jgi:hypothetical protein
MYITDQGQVWYILLRRSFLKSNFGERFVISFDGLDGGLQI